MCRFTLDSATESRIASEIPDVCATAPGEGLGEIVDLT